MASGSSDTSFQGVSTKKPILSNLGIVSLVPTDTSVTGLEDVEDPTEELASTPPTRRSPRKKKAASNNPWAVYPHTTDEPPVFVRLSNPESFAEMSGWSGLIPLRLFNTGLSDKSKYSDMAEEDGTLKAHVEPLMKRRVSLKELETLVRKKKKMQVKRAVHVQVIAKRRVEMFVTNRRVSLIPVIVVQDMSGYCLLCSYDEGVATVYNDVEIGDYLLITKSTAFIPLRAYHRGLFSKDMFLNLALKIPFDSVQEHFIRRFSSNISPCFKLPDPLFDLDCPLKSVSELETEFQDKSPPAPQLMGPPVVERYYDICGVISYVGRVERVKLKRPVDVDCVVDDEIVSRNYFPYTAFRWIHIVDITSKPLPVKIYLNNMTTAAQAALIPGVIVVISHCQTEETVYVTNYCKTSHFSQVYSGINISKYFMLHPNKFNLNLHFVINRINYADILARKDIVFSAGATHPLQITRPDKFLEFYKDSVPSHTIEPGSFARRESQRLYVRGTVYRVVKFVTENTPELLYQRGNLQGADAQMTMRFKTFENFVPFDEHRGSFWYSFIRKLPDINPNFLNVKRTEDIMHNVVGSFREYCSPLLMPAKFVNGRMPRVAFLEAMDGPPFYLVDIVDNEKKEWFRCIWKSCTVPHQVMGERLERAWGKNILGIIDIFCLEQDTPLEVQLHDFVLDDSQKSFPASYERKKV